MRNAALTDTSSPSRQNKSEPNPDALSARVVFRVTQAERSELEAAAASAGKSLTEYARTRVMRGGLLDHIATPKQMGRDIDQQAVAALNRAGVAMVQVAEKLTGARATVPENLDDVIYEIRDAIKILTARRR